LRKKIVNIDVPIALGITVLFLRSAYEILSQAGPGYLDSLSGLVFFLLIGKWYQGKTYQALSFERDYKSYFPVAVTIIDEEGVETTKPLRNLKIGDRIIVRNQELIPADAILLSGDAQIDYSFVSGESTPVSKKAKDRIFAGGRQMGSAIELMVEKEVVQSYLTELWNQDLYGKDEQSNLNSLVNVVSRYFTFAIIIIATAAGAFWYFSDPAVAMRAFTAVLIVACPCALALTIPFALGNTMRIFGRKGFYLKKTEVIEDLCRLDTVVFDKTGTITCNDEFEIDFSNLSVENGTISDIRSIVRHSSHPLSQVIYRSIREEENHEVESFNEIPSLGLEGRVGGRLFKIGSEGFILGKETSGDHYSSNVFVSVQGKSLGYIRIRNKYREGLSETIGELGKKYELHLLSGDNFAEKPYLLPLFHNENSLHFRQSPKDKLQYIRDLKASGKKVLMVGDGLNDAGALRESEVGITIADNVYHFSPACDAILDAGSFHILPWFLRFSRTAKRVVYAGFGLSFFYNIIGISFAASGLLTPLISAILMPLSSVSVVAFATFATSLLAKRV